jgi:hypothetical protein
LKDISGLTVPITPLQKEDPAGSVTTIIGGGAYHADDKIVQHNGCGSVEVSATEA